MRQRLLHLLAAATVNLSVVGALALAGLEPSRRLAARLQHHRPKFACFSSRQSSRAFRASSWPRSTADPSRPGRRSSNRAILWITCCRNKIAERIDYIRLKHSPRHRGQWLRHARLFQCTESSMPKLIDLITPARRRTLLPSQFSVNMYENASGSRGKITTGFWSELDERRNSDGDSRNCHKRPLRD